MWSCVYRSVAKERSEETSGPWSQHSLGGWMGIRLLKENNRRSWRGQLIA